MATLIDEMIAYLKAGRHLSRERMREVFELIMTGQVEPTAMGEFLKTLAAKGETVEEIAGAADVMNEKVTRVRCDADCIDTCGTGGDRISTLTVSSTAAVIAAAAGAVVAKHGNRTNTRVSGSAEVFAALGVNLDAPIPVLERCLRECQIAFLYAPNLHPAMKDFEVPQVPAYAEAMRPKAIWFLELLDKELASREFIAGPNFSVADITALVAYDFMKPSRIVMPDNLNNVKRWHAAVSSRPSAKA